MVLKEEKLLEAFDYEIPEECERDFALLVKQNKPIDINSLGLGHNNQRSDIQVYYFDGAIHRVTSFYDLVSFEDLYYSLPNKVKYQLKFIIPRADKSIDNKGLILPINDDSRNYFNIFLKGSLTQEDGFVSYNKIYNRINTRIPEKYRCNGNYIVSCKFLPFVLEKSKTNPHFYNDIINIFDITKDINSNKSFLLGDFNGDAYNIPSTSDLYFIMFDFNIEGYSEEDGIVVSAEDEAEKLKDLLYHRYSNIFPKKPYKIIHKDYFGTDIEILVYKKISNVDYRDIFSTLDNIDYRIGSGHDKFVMVWEKSF